MCGTNSMTNNITVLADGIKRNNARAGQIVNGQLTINTSNAYTEASDFSFMCVLIWDKCLNDTDLTTVSNYLMNYLKTGIHCKTIERYNKSILKSKDNTNKTFNYNPPIPPPIHPPIPPPMQPVVQIYKHKDNNMDKLIDDITIIFIILVIGIIFYLSYK